MKIHHALHAIGRVLRCQPKEVRHVNHASARHEATPSESLLADEERAMLAIALDPHMSDKVERLPLNVTIAPVSGMEPWGHPRLNGHYFINNDPDCVYRISYRQLCLFLEALRQAAPAESGQSLHLPSWLACLQEEGLLKSAPHPEHICQGLSDHTPHGIEASNLRERYRQHSCEDKQKVSSESSPSGSCKNRMDDYRRWREYSPVSIASEALLKTSAQYNTCSADEHRAALEALKGAPR